LPKLKTEGLLRQASLTTIMVATVQFRRFLAILAVLAISLIG